MSSDVVIRVEGLGKKYSIRHQRNVGYKTLREAVTGKAKDLFRAGSRSRENLIADVGALTSARATHEDFWALRDVSFEVKRGEVIGIIGRNGAGKSTLLKILSRITEPTEGRVRIKGRVASLLEVGTGFHPELTGRENVYLNGAVLGMSRSEIKRKFDEIIAFAETEKFLDTPVKRYSSGMYVRLAFAVAAHLEPEILVVDEVLAVGDAEFQKKCLGKMRHVAIGGRTVFFVSHNLAAVRSLTTTCLLLRDGRLVVSGGTGNVVTQYVAAGAGQTSKQAAHVHGSGGHTAVIAADLLDDAGVSQSLYEPPAPFRLQIDVATDGLANVSVDFFLCDANRGRIAFGSTGHFGGRFLPVEPGTYRLQIDFRPVMLAAGLYSIDVATAITNVRWDHLVEEAISFEVPDYNPCHQAWAFRQTFGYGALALVPQRPPAIARIEGQLNLK